MHINHQARRQGESLLVWNLNLGTSAIYSFVDVIAQGVLVCRKLEENPGFSTHSHSDIPLLGGVEPNAGCRSYSFLFSINIPEWVKLRLLHRDTVCLLTQDKAASLTLVGEMALHGPQISENRPGWFDPIGTLSFSVSLAVNTILTGLLVFKMAKTSLTLRHTHSGGIKDFTPLISVIIESGLVFFMAQLVWVVCFSVESMAFDLVSGPLTIIYVCSYLHISSLLSFNMF